MTDFWPSCGYAHLRPDTRGRLEPAPAYLRLFLDRPELALVSESCAEEIRLHESLLTSPLQDVTPDEVDRLQDQDAQHNYRVFLAFRNALMSHGTLENYYLSLFRRGDIQVPPVFIALIAQAILRHILQETTDALEARAAEILFRTQRISVQNGQVLAADAAAVDRHSAHGDLGEMGRLLREAKAPLRTAHFDVLNDDNAYRYWQADQRHDFLLDLTHEVVQDLSHGLTFRMTRARSGLKALSRVLEKWVAHLLGVTVRIQPVQQIDDPAWRWHVGLDAESSALLNDLYEGRFVEPERMQRLISLFRLDFENANEMRADVAGKPVYLGLMMSSDNSVKLKPQNLLLNLPLRATA